MTLVDEVKLGSARVDLLDLSTELHGYEIKSNHDSYTRLKNQTKFYNKYLSKITIVVGDKKVDSIAAVVPEFWGISVVYKCPAGRPQYEIIREPKPNPYFEKKFSITLLWKSELVSIASKLFNSNRFAQTRKYRLATMIQKEFTQKEAVQLIRGCLLMRIVNGGWRD